MKRKKGKDVKGVNVRGKEEGIFMRKERIRE